MKKLVYIVFLIGCFTYAQDEVDVKEKEKALNTSKNLTWEANKELSENKFTQAEANYRKAISKSNENSAAPYNLGSAYYNKETYSEAFGRFKQAGELAKTKTDKHKAYHNMGNVFMKNKEYEKAVEAYKQALRNNPSDEETRYNFALAKELLKKQQDEQKKNDQNKDDKKDNKEDQKDKNEDKEKNEGDGDDKKDDQGKDKDKKDGEDKEDKGDEGDKKNKDDKEGKGDDEKKDQKKPNDKGDKKPQEQQQQPRPNQLSKQQVKNLLKAMENEEKKVQEKMDAKKVKGAKVKNEKDW